MVLRRTGERVTEEVREDCVFVPLVGRQGWSVEHPAAK